MTTCMAGTRGRYYSHATTFDVAVATMRTRAMFMHSSGWGRHPIIETITHNPATRAGLTSTLRDVPDPVIPRGMGRSYGDASLAPHTLCMTRFDHFINFDIERGTIECGAGITLASLMQLSVAHGWFVPVLPGTGLVTLGGAIAADVHGKNHHHDGSFSQYVDEISLMLADGALLRCSRSSHSPLFHATAGGMGLTGVIVAARLRLRAVRSSFIEETVIAAKDLASTLALLDEHHEATYGVAWLDVNQHGTGRGRGLVMLGEHLGDGDLHSSARRPLAVPVDLPAGLLTQPVTRAFNALYFRRGLARCARRRVHYAQYFFPLDALRDWNRLYGKAGFMQHQCVIPSTTAAAALDDMLDAVSASGLVSPLAVLKGFGPANDNLLSFPQAGLTLTMDFAMSPATLALFARLDDIVVAHGGRLYLAKDACMSMATFRRGYPSWEAFQEIRARYGALGRFASLQSQRLGL